MQFLLSLQKQLAQFEPYLQQSVVIKSPYFSKTQQTVAQFVAEIQHTASLLAQENTGEYAEIYADRLLKQFSRLQSAVSVLESSPNIGFRSTYSFARNIHALPPAKRLPEYRKALRALNEKISWLIEQQLNAEGEKRLYFRQQIEETEYRKRKCLEAIEALGA